MLISWCETFFSAFSELNWPEFISSFLCQQQKSGLLNAFAAGSKSQYHSLSLLGEQMTSNPGLQMKNAAPSPLRYRAVSFIRTVSSARTNGRK
jgi:hypothetical protein